MFGVNKKRSISNAFDETLQGPSMSSAAMNSVYGWFLKQLHQLYPNRSTEDLVAKYPHPVMCVIGCESTGKSATIESMSKIPLFPSESGICTRCPLKVILIPTEPDQENEYTLQYKEKTLHFSDFETSLSAMKNEIARIFREIESTHADQHGYSSELITITVRRPDVVRMDFVDLPGIVSYPPSAKAFTFALSQQYISDPNCFILCVANATHPRLTSYEPIACIMAANAAQRTILVLPMADKLSFDDYETHLVNRVLLTSDEIVNQGFSACCALVNRSNVTKTLADHTLVEKEWFHANILLPLAEHAGSDADQERVQHVAERVGIDPLLRVVNLKYDEFIRTHWMPRTLEEIDRKLAVIEAQLEDLGVIPSLENTEQFRAEFTAHIWPYLWSLVVNCVQHETNLKVENMYIDAASYNWPVSFSKDVWPSLRYQLEELFFAKFNFAPSTSVFAYNLSLKWARFCPYLMQNILESVLFPYFEKMIVPVLDFILPSILLAKMTIGYGMNKGEEYGIAAILSHHGTRLHTQFAQFINVETLIENRETQDSRASLYKQFKVCGKVKRKVQGKIQSLWESNV